MGVIGRHSLFFRIAFHYWASSLHSWSAKLYLTPSNIVLLTAIALIGVCVFILAIIGILHWQEKVRSRQSCSYIGVSGPSTGEIGYSKT